ncbi:hypothetical protein B0J17DRAFT_134021 [Rhizoctonia solani]|nr:hypothetical protein B0J17DRAFT_134021 [Rhizoctonia solani]
MAIKRDSATCDVKFSMVERKHHCRMCGGIFCRACSSRHIPLHTNSPPRMPPSLPTQSLPIDDFPGPLINSRVCDGCYSLIYGSQNTLPPSSNYDPSLSSEPSTHIRSPPLLTHPKRSGTSSVVSPGYARIRRGSAQQSSSTIS